MANQYIQLLFQDISVEQSAMLVAALSEQGFDGFEEDDHQLKAFIDSRSFPVEAVNRTAEQLQVHFSQAIIEEVNWNQEWESSFEPVIVDDLVAIRASFHKPVPGIKDEIIITPKMSFGTGHHATTYLMISQMKDLDFRNKSVLDFGTGTGVLAIYAEKLGADRVVAIDNDEWSITNAKENLQHNHSRVIEIRAASSMEQVGGPFDIILANINKNVILENFAGLRQAAKMGSVLLLSGLLTEDEKDVINTGKNAGFTQKNRRDRHNWLSIKLSAC